jgi:hypothetical protein
MPIAMQQQRTTPRVASSAPVVLPNLRASVVARYDDNDSTEAGVNRASQ